MKKRVEKIVITGCVLLCMGIFFRYGCTHFFHMAGVDGNAAVWKKEVLKTLQTLPDKDGIQYANAGGSRIVYKDGYYYYASQLDHYYLYRVKEDGSDAVCLAKVRPGSLYVDRDTIYFVNLSDSNAIYRIGTDGSAMEKLCESAANVLQTDGKYIYFCDVYDEEADIRGLVLESEKEMLEDYGKLYYRMRTDGSGKELLVPYHRFGYVPAPTDGGNKKYTGSIFWKGICWNEETQSYETVVKRYALNGQSGEEICRFDFEGDILVYGERIYCFGYYYGADQGKAGVYSTENKEMISLPEKELMDYCIYNDVLYGLWENVDERERRLKVYKLEDTAADWEEIYDNHTICTASDAYYNGENLADLYATQQGIFLRQFVSSEEGVKWYSLTEKGAEKWEDEEQIPMTEPASMLAYTGEWNSIKAEFRSTEGYEEYLAEDLTHEDYYERGEDEEALNPYRICLPQFNEKIEGYQEINAYFQNAFQEALGYQETFFEMLDEMKQNGDYSTMLWEGTHYDYVYIGEKYITVAKYQDGYWGGRRSWHLEEPVTFERKTGKAVSLEDLYGTSLEEAVLEATGSIYKYRECVGWSVLREEDMLMEEYVAEQFFLFPEGIGIYYERYAIDCGAAGDFLFIVPFPGE